MIAPDHSTILIVEDDEGIAELEKQRLEDAGYAILTASTADQALAVLRAARVDLILLDYRLPGDIDGLNFYARVKASGQDVPVILVTGFSNEATVIQALRMGVRDFVTKSVEYLDYLPEAVNRVLKQIRIESQLAESEAQLASIIATAQDAILVTDDKRRVTLFNAAAERMFRYKAADALGKFLIEFIPPEVVQGNGRDDGSLSQLVRGGTRGVRADGSEFPLEATLSRHEAGGKHFYTVVVRDITERKRAEAALEQERHFLRALLESLNSGIVACDSKGILTLFNQTSRDFHGAKEEPLPPEAWPVRYGLFHVDGRTRLRKEEVPLYRALHGERFRDVEVMIIPKRGVPRTVRASGQPIQDQQGRTLGAVVTAEDITEKKKSEMRLREQAAILERAHDAIMIRDMDDQIVFWNHGAERLYGWTAQEAVGRNASEILYKVSSPPPHEAHDDVLSRGEWLGELQHVAKNGRAVTVSSHWTLLRDDQGQPRSKLVINTDVTEKKKLENQLQHSQRMEAIGVLGGGVAHDFNNLLTVIMGYSEMVLDSGNISVEDRELVHEIHRAGEQATSLTRQLLAFSRKQVLSPQILNLNLLIREMEKMLRRLIGADLDLAAVLDADLGRVKADPGQMEQVVMNLVVNARDAMPRGGRITIETRNIELDSSYAKEHLNVEAGPYVLLAVTDTGTGMDEATRQRIFEPFFTTKEQGKGTGLGLSTVHGIIRQSGGHIEVYSELGRGTTFKIYLPRLRASQADRAAPLMSMQVPRGSETILLTDDDEGIRTMARIALQSYGYTVIEAKDGDDGMKVALNRNAPIDLLITDVVMPKSSGRELVEKLRPAQPTMKVLYISGYTDDAIVRHGILEDGVSFLHKPFTPTTLARKVREVLDTNRLTTDSS